MPKSRPRRGTRERGFITEIAVIVVGVLIALAAGQLLENWNWGRKVDAGEQQLLREARINIRYAAEQVAVQPCLDAQLDTLRERILASDAILQPAPVYRDDMFSLVFRAPSRRFADSIWHALNDDGTTVHMHDARREILSEVYGSIDILHELAAETDPLVGRLMVLSHPLPLDSGARVTLVAALDEQQTRSTMQSLVAAQLLGGYRDFGVAFPTTGDELLAESGTVAFCREHGLPLEDWLAVMRAQPPLAGRDTVLEAAPDLLR